MLKKFRKIRKTAKVTRQYLDEKLSAKKNTRIILITGFTLHNTSEYLKMV